MGYNSGIIHLSSSDGAVLEIPESKLSRDDLDYVRSLYVHKKGRGKVISNLCRSPYHLLISFGTGTPTRCVYPAVLRIVVSRNPTASPSPTDNNPWRFFGKLVGKLL